MIGGMFEKGLAQMKSIAEARARPRDKGMSLRSGAFSRERLGRMADVMRG